MSDVLDRIRRELQQRLESTRAAAQEHERVRAALEALEHSVAPLEELARRAAGGGGRGPLGRAGGEARAPSRGRGDPSQARLRWPRAYGRHAGSFGDDWVV